MVEEKFVLLNTFLNVTLNSTVQIFRGVAPEYLHIIENLVKVNILVRNIKLLDNGTV